MISVPGRALNSSPFQFSRSVSTLESGKDDQLKKLRLLLGENEKLGRDLAEYKTREHQVLENQEQMQQQLQALYEENRQQEIVISEYKQQNSIQQESILALQEHISQLSQASLVSENEELRTLNDRILDQLTIMETQLLRQKDQLFDAQAREKTYKVTIQQMERKIQALQEYQK